MHRNPRVFGPLLGFFLSNFLTNAVIAKYAPHFPFSEAFDPNTMITYNGKNQMENDWKPASVAPMLLPENSAAEQDFANQSPDYELPNYNQQMTTHPPNQYDDPNGINDIEMTTMARPSVQLVAAGSNSRRGEYRWPTTRPRSGYTRRTTHHSQPRRRTTTPEYYDSYEMFSAANQRRKRPYYDDDDSYESEYDYYDYTTKSYRRRQRPGQKTKNQKRRKESTTEDYDFSHENAQTEILIVRQRQVSTTTESATLATTSTTTATTTEEGTMEPVTPTATPETPTEKPSSNTTIEGGYGPSNGNDNISFTYGPPYQFQVGPYIDWFRQESARNAIVKKVHDIVGYDRSVRKLRN